MVAEKLKKLHVAGEVRPLVITVRGKTQTYVLLLRQKDRVRNK